MDQGKNVLRLVADSLLLINEASMSAFGGKADIHDACSDVRF